MTANTTPLEKHEQAAFVDWLEVQGLTFTAIPNSTYTTSFNQKRMNRQQGVRKGFPDMVVIIPPHRSVDGEGYMLCIENKRIKGGVQSPEQKEWQAAINGLNVLNVQYYLCKGAAKAIETVSHYLAKVDNSAF